MRAEDNDLEQLARVLARPSESQETRLRIWFGDAFEEMQELAANGAGDRAEGNVVVLAGFPGTSLNTRAQDGHQAWLWLNPVEIVPGHLERLRLQADGQTSADPRWTIEPSTPMALVYGLLCLALRTRWRVYCYAADWRLDLAVAAQRLDAFLRTTFGGQQPVHFVAHSFGGLLVRKFLQRYRKHWDVLWDRSSNGQRGGRLVMMGTPNHGAFAAVQGIAGIYGNLDALAAVDQVHSKHDLREIVATFPGLYQGIPSGQSPPFDPVYRKLFQPSTYDGAWPLDPHHLEKARNHVEHFGDAVDVPRMIFIAGTNQPTPSGIQVDGSGVFQPLDQHQSYLCTLAGDGLATHDRSLLRDHEATVPMHVVEERHARLPLNRTVLDQMHELLLNGEWTAGTPRARPESDLPELLEAQRRRSLAKLERVQAVTAELANAPGTSNELEQLIDPATSGDRALLATKRELTGLLLDL